MTARENLLTTHHLNSQSTQNSKRMSLHGSSHHRSRYSESMSLNGSSHHRSRYSDSSLGSKSDEIKELDFSPCIVDSREQACASLATVYHNVKNPPDDALQEQSSSGSNMILISGVSGTGKSTLVQQFINEVNMKSNLGKDTKPYFLMGKYNKKSGTPYSAIIAAFSDFTNDLIPSKSSEEVSKETEREIQRLRDQIKATVGNDARHLAKVIPDLNRLLGVSDTSLSSEEDDCQPSEGTSNRLKYVFQSFVNAISTKERPIVLFLDDLQWIDDASLKLIYSLMIDSDLLHFMFIGAYRSDEVNSGDALWNTLERVQMVQEYETIGLTNLSKPELADTVAHILCLVQRQKQKRKLKHDKSRALIEELTDILYKKTDGNLFFATQTIKELDEREVLTFSLFSSEWELDWTTVDKSGFLTDDVMTMVTGKLNQSSNLLQQILKTMAFTKSPIDISLIRELLDGSGVKVSLMDLVEELDLGASQGLLSHKIGSPDYTFAHDKIQEAAYALVSEGQDSCQYRSLVGMQLLKMHNRAKSSKMDWMLFVATDHLNAARENESEFLFHLNIKAGEKAASVAAHDTSSKFLRRALKFISSQTNPWQSKYDLSLRTHETLARVLLLQGEYEDGKALAQTLLDNAKSIDDKLPTLIALSVALGKEHKQKESLKLSLKTLHTLKECPKGNVGVIAGVLGDFMAAKRFFKTNTDEDVLKLPLMKSERKRRVMQLFSSAMVQAQFSGDTLTNVSVIMKMLRITFKYGLCGESVVALVVYSIVVDGLNDVDGRKRLMNLAAKVMKKTKANDEESLMKFVGGYFFGCWNESFDNLFATFERGHTTGMEYGRYEDAFLCATAATTLKLVAGFPLPGVAMEYASLRRKMSLYAVDRLSEIIWETYNVCQVLIGAEELDFERFYDFQSTPCDPSQYIARKSRCVAGMQLGFYFGNLEFCEKMITEERRLPDHDKGFLPKNQFDFFVVLCCSSLYLKTRKKSYFRQAKKKYKTLLALALPRGDNCRLRFKIMKAHMKACKGGQMMPCEVKNMYDEVISDASDSDHKHDAGLVAQLAADYFLHHDRLGDHNKEGTLLIRTYLEQARDFYKIWGATALVADVEDGLLSVPRAL